MSEIKLISVEDLEGLVEGLKNQNHAAELMLAKLSFGLTCIPSEPDMMAHDGPCCSELEDGCWLSTGCDCGNYDDCSNAEDWRNNANRYERLKKYIEAATRNPQEDGE